MKTRTLVLLMSLFAMTPAILGNAWAGSKRANSSFAPESLECNSRHAKTVVAKNTKSQEQKPDAVQGSIAR